jgi:hypothetical protein
MDGELRITGMDDGCLSRGRCNPPETTTRRSSLAGAHGSCRVFRRRDDRFALRIWDVEGVEAEGDRGSVGGNDAGDSRATGT